MKKIIFVAAVMLFLSLSPVQVMAAQLDESLSEMSVPVQDKLQFSYREYVWEVNITDLVQENVNTHSPQAVYTSLYQDTAKLDNYLYIIDSVLKTLPDVQYQIISDEAANVTAVEEVPVYFQLRQEVKTLILQEVLNRALGMNTGNIEMLLNDGKLKAYTMEGIEAPDTLYGLLSSYQTSYFGSDEGRTANVEVSAAYIDGTYMLPGETISFDKVLMPRTYEYGYRMAEVYSAGKKVPGMGGGLCQVTSTAHMATLNTNVAVVERYSHSGLVDYVPLGMDAAIAAGYKDFKIRNDYEVPVYIAAKTINQQIFVGYYIPVNSINL